MDSIKWGNQKGKQRYKCKNCGILFTAKSEGRKRSNEIIWFRKWILERLTYRYLVKDSGYSKSTLERKFKYYLSRAPKFQIRRNQSTHLVMDATYFKGDLCLMLYYDFDLKYCQMYRFGKQEFYTEIKEDLENIQLLGIKINSITSDGNKAILKAIKDACPDIIHQRCIVHIQRECNIWLRKKPISQSSKDLKRIVNYLPQVKTNNDKMAWIKLIEFWFSHYESHIKEKTVNEQTGNWWYKHKNLRRAAIAIKRAIPNMFHYIDNPNIPNNTNSIESFFGHLKDTLSIHRGLSKANRKSFILWYLHFKNQSRSRF